VSKSFLRIGEMARLLGVTPKTVRHYHKLGLIPEPGRSEGGYRLYTTADLFALQRIRRLQSLGLSLQQIKFILDADDPDDLLCTTLEGLQKELAAQEKRLADRRDRIERYLAEGVSLARIEQHDTPSPTYQLLAEKANLPLDLPDGLAAFDMQVFGQLDAFNWGGDYAAGWETVAAYFDPQSEHFAEMNRIIQVILALQTMAEDDPQIAVWAQEIRQSPILQALSAGVPGITSTDMHMSEAMQQIFAQSADQHLTPAQRRFLELLVAPSLANKSSS
jgi:DNA-binding transcriptional MerR regulator